mgnify:CR=1 FL=1
MLFTSPVFLLLFLPLMLGIYTLIPSRLKPSAICIYEKPSETTIPGTETNVTPDIAAPTMAMAATTRCVERPPVKKVPLSMLRLLSHATINSMAT